MGRWINRHLSSADIQMAKRHKKRCSTSLIIRQIQIKITMKYHLTQVRTTIIKKSTNNKCWKKGNPITCWWECKLIQPLWRRVWRFLKRLKTELPYDPAIPLLGIYPEKTKIQSDTCSLQPYLQKPGRTWKQPKCPKIDEWIKRWYIYTSEYYLVIKKNKIESSVEMWMDLQSVILTEVNQKEKNTVYQCIHVECKAIIFQFLKTERKKI